MANACDDCSMISSFLDEEELDSFTLSPPKIAVNVKGSRSLCIMERPSLNKQEMLKDSLVRGGFRHYDVIFVAGDDAATICIVCGEACGESCTDREERISKLAESYFMGVCEGEDVDAIWWENQDQLMDVDVSPLSDLFD